MQTLISFVRTHKRRFLAGAALILLIGLGLAYRPGELIARRPATAHETLLYFFAQNLGEAALCDRISWAAYQSYSVLFGGGGASLYRSDCYEQVAQARHDPSICWRVMPLVDFNPLSAGYSALACRRRTNGNWGRSATALSQELFVHDFEQMGYDIDAIRIEGLFGPAIRVRDLYYALQKDMAALARAQLLLTQRAPSLPADDRSYLAQLVAIGTANPDLCTYIPQDQRIGQVVGPFRDWCFYTVAFDIQDIRICDRMTPAAEEAKVQDAKAHGVAPEIAEQMGLHASCIRSEKRLGPLRRYGPEIPRDDAQTLRLLALVGVPVPSARDWPLSEKAAYWHQFVFALWPSEKPDTARDAARAELVRRLLALPGGA